MPGSRWPARWPASWPCQHSNHALSVFDANTNMRNCSDEYIHKTLDHVKFVGALYRLQCDVEGIALLIFREHLFTQEWTLFECGAQAFNHLNFSGLIDRFIPKCEQNHVQKIRAKLLRILSLDLC